MKLETIKAIINAMPCASDDATRYHYMGVHLEQVGSKTVLKATNGHLAVIRELDDTIPAGRFMLFREALAGLKAVIKERKAIGETSCDLDAKGQLVIGDLMKVTAEKVTVDFPNIEAIVPKYSNTVKIGLNAEYILRLAKALKEEERSREHVVIEFDPSKTLSAVLIHGATKGSSTAVLMPIRI